MSDKTPESILGQMQPSRAIVKLAVPATLALLAKAVYNIVDTAYQWEQKQVELVLQLGTGQP